MVIGWQAGLYKLGCAVSNLMFRLAYPPHFTKTHVEPKQTQELTTIIITTISVALARTPSVLGLKQMK